MRRPPKGHALLYIDSAYRFHQIHFLADKAYHSFFVVHGNRLLPTASQPHAVFDIVVNDEFQLFVGKAVMFSEYTVDLINDVHRRLLVELIVDYLSGSLVSGLLACLVLLEIRH